MVSQAVTEFVKDATHAAVERDSSAGLRLGKRSSLRNERFMVRSRHQRTASRLPSLTVVHPGVELEVKLDDIDFLTGLLGLLACKRR